MNHLVLLGDSIFDNAAYTQGGPSVIQHLQTNLSQGWRATLLAIDGSMVQDVSRQVDRTPSDASHLIVSAGGNNALDNINILGESAGSTAEVLNRLADVREQFEVVYRAMLRSILSHELPTAVCTIYYPNFRDNDLQRIASAALIVFNDVIIREAVLAGVPLIDLRLVCDEARDYANDIEPSPAGGAKISNAIMKLVSEHRFEHGRTEIYF